MTCFDQWARNVYQIRRQRGILARIRMRMKSRSTIASFSRWTESVEKIRSNRQLLRRLLSNLTKTKSISALQRWKQFAKNTIKYENLMKSRLSFFETSVAKTIQSIYNIWISAVEKTLQEGC